MEVAPRAYSQTQGPGIGTVLTPWFPAQSFRRPPPLKLQPVPVLRILILLGPSGHIVYLKVTHSTNIY